DEDDQRAVRFCRTAREPGPVEHSSWMTHAHGGFSFPRHLSDSQQVEDERVAGRVKRNCAPPSEWFETAMLPPCAVMIDWQMARPTPIPLSFVVKKLSKTRSRFSSAIPGPLSRIEKQTASALSALVSRSIRRIDRSTCATAWMLLTSRLTITCCT